MRNKKWPIVLPPLPLECLSSWLHRVAKQYGLTAAQLVNSLLRENHAELRITLVETLDSFAPPIILQLLSKASALPEARLRRMTLTHFVPHLAEHNGEPLFRRFTFADYIRGFSFMPAHLLPEATEPLLPWDRLTVAKDMPVCMSCLRSDHRLHTKLTWRFNIVASCPWHGAQIHPMRVFTRSLDQWDYFENPDRFKPHPCLDLLDGITNWLFHYGSCNLADGVTISARWWMRCLRGMAEEVRRAAMLHDHGVGVPTEFTKMFKQYGMPSREALAFQRPLEEMSPADSAQIWVCVGALLAKLCHGEMAPYYEESRLTLLHGIYRDRGRQLEVQAATQAIGA